MRPQLYFQTSPKHTTSPAHPYQVWLLKNGSYQAPRQVFYTFPCLNAGGFLHFIHLRPLLLQKLLYINFYSFSKIIFKNGYHMKQIVSLTKKAKECFINVEGLHQFCKFNKSSVCWKCSVFTGKDRDECLFLTV